VNQKRKIIFGAVGGVLSAIVIFLITIAIVLAAENGKNVAEVGSVAGGYVVTGVISVISAIIGGLVGSGLTVFISWRRRRNEYKSYILVIAAELILAFERCALYEKQREEGVVSFSGIFDFIDATVISNFAAVCSSPDVVVAIINLKFSFFQIGRHVEDASRFATEATRAHRAGEEHIRLMEAASVAQAQAIAFFAGPPAYERIVRDLGLVINTTIVLSPRDTAQEILKRFEEARSNKK
jgi:hypothetical protein